MATPITITKADESNVISLFKFNEPAGPCRLPLFLTKVQAGFPSPADDYKEKTLEPNDYLVTNKASTFFVRVKGDAMIDAGIFAEDVLIIDRSYNPKIGDIVMVELDGEFLVRYLNRCKSGALLVSANKKFHAIEVKDNPSFSVWGVVTGSMRKYK